ncbi:hypothetical protein EDC26_11663 [Paralcaligenes ureilyticus]|uniref:Uncharacterized protein n=1 Tax=Paralcaligenes ureilyticus TaxID=627131 RepID=A0A4R3LTA5_9BURK|nr:hypothetical protein EDC26_11663 [Paralcaligenes ureilyticus]
MSHELFIIIVGSIMVAYGVISLYFGSESAQRKFNPRGETRRSPKTTNIIDTDYRVRPK